MAITNYEHVLLAATSTTSSVTNVAHVETADWTITVPGGYTASTINVQVNNHRNIDPTSANRRLMPQDRGLRSIAKANNVSISAATEDSAFVSKWVVLGQLTGSAYTGAGHYRFIRLAVANAASTWFDGDLEAYVSTYHHHEMV